MFTQPRMLRDVGSGDGGGTGTGPSLMDILNGAQEGLEDDGLTLKPGYIRNGITGAVTKDANYKPANPGMTPPEGFDFQGNLKPGYKLAEDGKTAIKDDGTGAAGGAREGVDENNNLLPGYMKDATGNVVKNPDWIDPAEGKNEDGTLKAGYKELQDGSIVKDPDYKAPGAAAPGAGGEGDDVDEAQEFITAVENITGIKYEIEYPEGVDPISPEGVAVRETFIRENAMVEFEQYLQQKDPRGYAYMMHRATGGTDEQFLGDNKGYQLPAKADMQASADSRAAVYKQELLSVNSLDPTTAQLIVDAAIKDNTLTDKSDKAWDKLDKLRVDQLASLQALQTQAETKFKTELATLNETLTSTIKSGMGFVVPEADQPAFKQFIIDNMRYENGKFFIVQPVDDKSLKNQLESLFLLHKKGDLTKIVTKQAQTQAAQKLRLRTKDTKPVPGAGAGGTNISKDNLPLHAILPTQGQN